jgi:hypothetical protein
LGINQTSLIWLSNDFQNARSDVCSYLTRIRAYCLILSGYNKSTNKISSLPFDTLFTSEKAFAYHINFLSKENKKLIENRGPMVVIVVSGPGLIMQNQNDQKQQEILQGKFFWIEPGTNFSIQNSGMHETSAVIFELK